MPLSEAFDLAEKRELDIIQVTEKLDPPVCKLMDYGKYLYWQEKKQKEAAKHGGGGDLKGIRLSFGISEHDMETRVRKAEEFLKKGDKVRIEMVLRGREKTLGNFAKEKMSKFLDMLNNIIPIKTEKELKREMRGFTMIIAKK